MKRFIIIGCLLVSFSCKEARENSQGENFSSNVDKVAASIIDDSDQLTFFDQPRSPLKPEFEQFSTGSVAPKGWILKMMKSDLETGVVGALDELYPGIKSDDIYNTARRGGLEDVPEMGDLVLTGAAWEKSIMWWNSETIGNWWDGFIRHALLTEDDEAIAQSHKIIANLLDSQDEDGYIGIYKPNLRYQHEGSNGELWAQTTAFRTMLAYYEFTQDERVLEAVERAMKVTMNNYGEDSTNPFYLKNAFGGVTHGLMLTDVCETLFRITKNAAYQDYATYLYKAFSTYSVNRSFNDLRYPYLIQKDSMFEGHGVHTYEHLRTMVNAYYNTGYSEMKTAYDNMLDKLEPCILPSGAGHGNEWIAKLKAHPTQTSSEYCTMVELRNSYGSLIQKTGNSGFADAAEKLTYNAMLGFRNRKGTAITYGKPDNCYVLDGHHHENGEAKADPRYKYSPTHSEPAVCCVPNYGRNFTYFLEQMWMKKEDGIVAVMFGPSQLTTQWQGNAISIEQVTNYPMSDEVTFKLTMDAPTTFKLYVRQPGWSDGLVDDSRFDGIENGYYVINREWKDGDQLTINFKNSIKINSALNDEVYIQKGPLVYAFEIPHKEESIKDYENGFRDYYCFPTDKSFEGLKFIDDSEFNFNVSNETPSFYNSEMYIQGEMYDTARNRDVTVRLIPMGKTVLRRVTFPKNKS
ncbi:beta-L-arabinofuranosidase domain-containing protein [Winogradskyella tangerina]|uniref:beta-L-arabinofuranosidase domain-containing protein n=1 Tax=Winogradskyella tangerina TaxID=2023240 RepID=UPI000DBE913A|nr:beta-L-arabinofuranosidase domain-containing protein [Winogradskyella tangerina]